MALSTAGFSTQVLGFIGADTGITDIISTRFYNGRLPQLDTFPALTFSIISLEKIEVKGVTSGYYKIRVQFDCYDEPNTAAGSTNECEGLFDAVHTAFDRFKDSAGAIEFHETFYKNRTAMVQDFDTKIYSISTDFEFHIK
jgi:hypothetical protein